MASYSMMLLLRKLQYLSPLQSVLVSRHVTTNDSTLQISPTEAEQNIFLYKLSSAISLQHGLPTEQATGLQNSRDTTSDDGSCFSLCSLSFNIPDGYIIAIKKSIPYDVREQLVKEWQTSKCEK